MSWLACLRELSAPTTGREISRSDAHAGLGHENAQHPTRFVDATAPRHDSLRQAVLHRYGAVRLIRRGLWNRGASFGLASEARPPVRLNNWPL